MGPTGIRLVIACAMLFPVAPLAHADDSERPVHWGIGIGGFSALTGRHDKGPYAEVELYPGGALGRFGFRADVRGLDDTTPVMVTAGITYEAAASRPRLQLALHTEAGIADRDPVVGGGVQTQLWLVGPVAIGVDSTVHFRYEGLDSELILAGALTLRVAD
jgi:hypothetical protein